MASMSQVQDLSTLSRLALESFSSLTEHLSPSSSHYQRLDDIRQRFKIWSGNIGAPHAVQNQRSLEYRVRATPKLKTRLAELLRDVGDDLDELVSLLASPAREEHADAFDATFDDLIETLNESIRTLFKTSGIARRAVTRDRYALALNKVPRSQVTDEKIDFERIGDLFPRLRLSKYDLLRTRLAKANNLRRRYLQYCDEHQASVVAGTSRVSREETPPDPLDEDEIEKSSQAAKSRATTVNAAAFEAATTEKDDAESVISEFSYVTDSASPMRYRVVDLQDVNSGQEDFVCPYCRTEQSFASQGRWKKHVLSDIKAYVCLDKDCDVELFDNSRAWMHHQLTTHLVQRNCPYCKYEHSYSTVDEFEMHLRQEHRSKFDEEQLPQICKVCEREPADIPASACPFCDWPTKLEYQNLGSEITVSLQRYRRHIGSHMEQAALAVLPGEDAEDSDYGEHGFDKALERSSDLEEMSLGNQDEVSSQVMNWNSDCDSDVHDTAVNNPGGLRGDAEEISDKALGKEHSDTLASMDNLASTYWNQGRLREAEELQVKVMEMRRATLGPDHPNTLTSMENLASTYLTQGQLREAEVLQVKVMEMRQAKLALHHPDTLASMDNLASTYWKQGQLRDAVELQVKVMEMRQATPWLDHPNTLTSMANLASTYWIKDGGRRRRSY